MHQRGHQFTWSLRRRGHFCNFWKKGQGVVAPHSQLLPDSDLPLPMTPPFTQIFFPKVGGLTSAPAFLWYAGHQPLCPCPAHDSKKQRHQVRPDYYQKWSSLLPVTCTITTQYAQISTQTNEWYYGGFYQGELRGLCLAVQR